MSVHICHPLSCLNCGKEVRYCKIKHRMKGWVSQRGLFLWWRGNVRTRFILKWNWSSIVSEDTCPNLPPFLSSQTSLSCFILSGSSFLCRDPWYLSAPLLRRVHRIQTNYPGLQWGTLEPVNMGKGSNRVFFCCFCKGKDSFLRSVEFAVVWTNSWRFRFNIDTSYYSGRYQQ